MRGDHGMTHSVYIADPDGNGIEVLYELPADVWEDDLNGALNYFKPLPLDGLEAPRTTPTTGASPRPDLPGEPAVPV